MFKPLPLRDRLRHALALFVFFFVCAIISAADAQTAPPWNENRIQWSAPVGCLPVNVACPAIMNYRVERAAVSSGPWATLATVAGTVLTYTHTGAAAGVNCYRIVALPAGMPPNLASQPSAHLCKTNVEPLPPITPNPPSDLRFVTPLVGGQNMPPVFTVLADGSRSSTVGGFAEVGTPCEGPVLFRYRNKDWRKPVTWTPWNTSATAKVAAPCAPRA